MLETSATMPDSAAEQINEEATLLMYLMLMESSSDGAVPGCAAPTIAYIQRPTVLYSRRMNRSHNDKCSESEFLIGYIRREILAYK